MTFPHPISGSNDLGQFQWPPAPPRPNLDDDYHKQVFAFLKRNGAPDNRIYEERLFAVGKEPSPLFPYVLWRRGEFPSIFDAGKVNTFDSYEDNLTLFDTLMRMTESQTGPYMIGYYPLLLKSPNVALMELEVRFKFGNPFVTQEVFHYVKQPDIVPPRPAASNPVGPAIEHGDGTSFYCDP